MTRRTLRLSLRQLKKNVVYTVLVILGLAVGITAFIATMQWSSWHLTFDRSFEDSQRIYRLTLEEKKEGFYRHMARVIHGDILRSIAISDAFSEIEQFARLSPFRNAIIRIEDVEFNETYAYACDKAWIDIFKPEVILGDNTGLLSEPNTAVITESTAMKLFGEKDPIGKTFRITHQFSVSPTEYRVTALIRDLPEKSHLAVSILTSIDNPLTFDETAWTYLKLREGSSPAQLEHNLKLYIDSNFEEDYVEKMRPRLQAISEIHLHSHKPREIKPNVSYKSVIILMLTGLFVFVLSWFNFMLLSVSQNQLNIRRLVTQWQMGAGKDILFRQFLTDFLLIGSLAMIAGILFTLLLRNRIALLTGHYIFEDHTLFLVIILFLIVLLVLSSLLTSWYSTYRLYRYVKYKYLSAKSTTPPDAAMKNYFVRWVIISEFIITFVLISNLFLIQKQTNYATSLQMGANDPTTIQIPNLSRYVIDRYQIFREKLLQNPLISNVTGTMEEPTGLTMDAYEFFIDGIDKNENRLYLFPAEEHFTRFYNIEVIHGEDMPLDYNPADSVEHYFLNESAAQMIIGSDIESLVGREMELDFSYPGIIGSGRISGIIKDFHLSGLDYEITPMVIFPKHLWLYCFAIRIKGEPKEAEAFIKATWEELFPDYPLAYSYTVDMINAYYKAELTEIKIRMIFSILSILIAGTGLFALSGFFMSRKMKYAAIRKISGAHIGDVLMTELLYYLYIALIASAIAVLPSYFLMERWLRNFYYKLNIPIYVFIISAVILVVFSWLSVIYHSWRLARLNPVNILKD